MGLNHRWYCCCILAVGAGSVISTSVAVAIAGDIVLSLEKCSDFVTELDNLINVAQIFAALVIETKASGVLEGVWDDSSRHFPDQEFADFFDKKVEIFIDLE